MRTPRALPVITRLCSQPSFVAQKERFAFCARACRETHVARVLLISQGLIGLVPRRGHRARNLPHLGQGYIGWLEFS